MLNCRLYSSIALFSAILLWSAVPALAQSEAELIDRIQRLESQMRQLNGRVEELQFRNREMDAALKRFQSDAEYRFGELEKGGNRGGGARPAPQPAVQPQQQPPQRRSDAYDPTQAQTAQPPQGARPGPGVPPMDLGSMSQNALNNPALAPGRPAGASGPVGQTTEQPIIATSTPREEYDQAVRLLQSRDYEGAEQAFRSFVQRNPRNALAGDAYYQIGETHYQRRQFRDAAENYLKVTTDYPRASRAASSLLRLGQSLYGLGEKESACAAYAELNRKYSTATSVINSAKAEQARAKC